MVKFGTFVFPNSRLEVEEESRREVIVHDRVDKSVSYRKDIGGYGKTAKVTGSYQGTDCEDKRKEIEDLADGVERTFDLENGHTYNQWNALLIDPKFKKTGKNRIEYEATIIRVDNPIEDIVAIFELYKENGDDANPDIYGVNWRAQTFKHVESGFKITKVRLRMFRYGNPGTIDVSIRAVDVNGHPITPDLTSGSTNGNTLPTTLAAAEDREITLTEYSLAIDTKYAIVVRATGGSSSNCVYWVMDNNSPTYANGNGESSGDSGGTWTTQAWDYMFEVWGKLL